LQNEEGAALDMQADLVKLCQGTGENSTMRQARLLSFTLGLVAALAALPAFASAASTTPTLLGFADDLGRVTRGAPGVAGTSEVARLPINWVGVRTNGWEPVDQAVDAARASGQRLFFTVTGLQAPDLAEWQSFLTDLQARYPDLWAVQAWNEPNLGAIGGDLTVDQTIGIVQAARSALPGVRLVGPSVSPTVEGAADYQRQLYAALPDDIGVGVNIYTYRKDSPVADVLDDYHRAKSDGGAADVYVTEIGFHGAVFSNQALASSQAFEALRQEGAATVIFYRLLPNPDAVPRWEQTGHFAVLNDDLSPTPTLIALHNALTLPVDIDAPKLKFGDVNIDRVTRRVEVEFSAGDDVTRKRDIDFRCELDKAKPARCSSPKVFKRLSYGPHRLDVTATDGTGNETSDFVTFKVRKP
jgi:hypothetical protein